MDNLRQQVMINQFLYVSGCHPEQAKQYLMSCNWNFEMALSMFFQETTVAPSPSCSGVHSNCQYQMCDVPSNTPVTPPSFSETLSAFSKLLTSEKMTSHPSVYSSTSLMQAGTNSQQFNVGFTSKQ